MSVAKPSVARVAGEENRSGEQHRAATLSPRAAGKSLWRRRSRRPWKQGRDRRSTPPLTRPRRSCTANSPITELREHLARLEAPVVSRLCAVVEDERCVSACFLADGRGQPSASSRSAFEKLRIEKVIAFDQFGEPSRLLCRRTAVDL